MRNSSIKTSLEINNLTDFDISEDFLFEIAKKTFEAVEMECLVDKKVSISAALVSEKEIAKLNSDYRGKENSTDVLSFSEYAKIQDLCNNKEREIFLGEIVISPGYIEKSSKEQGCTFSFETAYIFSHGILHLLGFSHGKKMFSLQEEVARNIKEKTK